MAQYRRIRQPQSGVMNFRRVNDDSCTVRCRRGTGRRRRESYVALRPTAIPCVLVTTWLIVTALAGAEVSRPGSPPGPDMVLRSLAPSVTTDDEIDGGWKPIGELTADIALPLELDDQGLRNRCRPTFPAACSRNSSRPAPRGHWSFQRRITLATDRGSISPIGLCSLRKSTTSGMATRGAFCSRRFRSPASTGMRRHCPTAC